MQFNIFISRCSHHWGQKTRHKLLQHHKSPNESKRV